MKYTIVLMSLILTACGSSSHQGTSGAAGVGTAFKHVLLIVDPESANLSGGASAPGYDFTIKQAGGWSNCTTLDGTVIDGAAQHVGDWMAEQDYDVVMFAMGLYEFEHDYSPGYYVHQSPTYQNNHFKAFLDSLKATGTDAKLIYLPMGASPSSYAYNNQAMYGLTILDTASDSWTELFAAMQAALK